MKFHVYVLIFFVFLSVTNGRNAVVEHWVHDGVPVLRLPAMFHQPPLPTSPASLAHPLGSSPSLSITKAYRDCLLFLTDFLTTPPHDERGSQNRDDL